MRSLSKKKLKVMLSSIGAVVLALIMVLSGVGIYLKVSQKENKPQVEVGPLDFSFDAWDGSTDYQNYNENYAGRGSFTKTINSAESFVHFINEVNAGVDFKNYTIYLNSNIDFKGRTIPSIGNSTYKFNGIFDGGYYTLLNAKISGKGLFGHTEDAIIKNLGLYNSNVSLIDVAENTDIENCFVRLGNGNLANEYISNNGKHKIENCFVDSSASGLISKIDTNNSGENTVEISNSYFTNGNNAVVSQEEDVFVTGNEVGRANEINFSKWSYSNEYSSESDWCDYDYLSESNKLDFNYPIQSGFAKVYLTGSCYESVMVAGDTVVDTNNLAQAFEEASKQEKAEINLLVEKVFMEARAQIKTNTTVVVNAVKDTTIVRGENNVDSMFVGDGSSKIILGNVDGVHSMESSSEEATLTLDGGKADLNSSQNSGALVVANGSEVQIGKNVVIKDNINNSVKYGGGVLLINASENSNIEATIEGCHADYAGGGICVVGAVPENLGNVRNCSTNGNGGGIALLKNFTSSATVQTIRDIYGINTAISPMSSTPTVEVSLDSLGFTNNSAKYGAAIYADENIILNIGNVTFDDNAAANNGGAIYSLGQLNIVESIIIDNDNEQDKLGYSEIYAGGSISIGADIDHFSTSIYSAAIGLEEDSYIDLLINRINQLKVYKENISLYEEGKTSGLIFKKWDNIQILSIDDEAVGYDPVQDNTFSVVNMPESCALALDGDEGIVAPFAAVVLSGVTPSNLTIAVGSTATFTASQAGCSSFGASAGSSSVVTVTRKSQTNGTATFTVTAVSPGTVNISVTGSGETNGMLTSFAIGSVKVTVTKATPKITISATSLTVYAGSTAVTNGTASITVKASVAGALKAVTSGTATATTTVAWVNKTVSANVNYTQTYYGQRLLAEASSAGFGTKTCYFTFIPTDTTKYEEASSEKITIKVYRSNLSVPSQSGTLAYNGKEQSPSWNSNYKSSLMLVSGNVGTNAGSYTATFTLDCPYSFQWNGSAVGVTTKKVNWAIGAKSLTVPTQKGSLAYTGKSLAPDWNNYNSSEITWSSSTAAVDAGTYTAIFKLKSTTNYKWADGSTANKSVTWTIERAPITALTVEMGNYTYNTTPPNPVVTGNLGEATPVYSYSNKKDGTYSTWTKSVVLIPDTYYMKVSVPATTNYKSATSEPTAFTVNKMKATISLSATSFKINSGGKDFSGGYKNVTVTSNIAGTLQIYRYTSEVYNVGFSWSSKTVTANTGNTITFYGSNVGTANWFFGLTPTDSTYYDTTYSANISIEVTKASITVPTQKNTSLEYTGTSQSVTWNNYNTKFMTVSGTTSAIDHGTYTAKFTLTSTTNYQWADGTTAAKSVSWKIGKQNVIVPSQSGTLVYSGATLNPTWKNYDTDLMTIGGTTSGVNAKSYNATFTLKSTANYQWADGTTSGVHTVAWSITKKSISPTLTFSDYIYGESVPTPSVLGNTGNGSVTYSYKTKGAADSTYKTWANITSTTLTPGEYTLRAVITETTNYASKTITKNFIVVDPELEDKIDDNSPSAISNGSSAQDSTGGGTPGGGGEYIPDPCVFTATVAGKLVIKSNNTSIVKVSKSYPTFTGTIEFTLAADGEAEWWWELMGACGETTIVLTFTATDTAYGSYEKTIPINIRATPSIQPNGADRQINLKSDQTTYTFAYSSNYAGSFTITSGNTSVCTVSYTTGTIAANTSKTCTVTKKSNANATITVIFTPTDTSAVKSYTRYVYVNKYYTLTLNPNSGTVSPTTMEVNYGQTYGTLPTPTRAGYDFDGWYYGNAHVTASSTIATDANHTIVAAWTIKQVAITGVPRDGNEAIYIVPGETFYRVADLTVTPGSGSHICEVSDSTKFGLKLTPNPNSASSSISGSYTKIYLFLKTTMAGEHSAYVRVTDNNNGTTATSTNFTVNVYYYSLTLHYTNGSVYKTVYPRCNSSLVYNGAQSSTTATISTLTRTGYNFAGYATEGGTKVINANGTLVSGIDGYTTDDGYWGLTANVDLYPIWTAATYTVSFDSQGAGIDLPSKQVAYMSTYGTLPEITREGYLFVDWIYDNEVVREDTIVSVASNHTLKAQWKPLVTGVLEIIKEDVYLSPNGSNCILIGSYEEMEGLGSFYYALSGHDCFGMSTSATETIAGNLFRTTQYSTGGTIYIYFTGADIGTYTCAIIAIDSYTQAESYPVEFTINVHRYRLDVYDETGETLKYTVYPHYGTYDVYTSSLGYGLTDFVAPSLRKGYRFVGWFTSTTGGSMVVENDAAVYDGISGYTSYSGWALNGNKKVYERWAPKTITANVYAATGAEVIRDVVVTKPDGTTSTHSVDNSAEFQVGVGDTLTLVYSATGCNKPRDWDVETDNKYFSYVYSEDDMDGNSYDGIFTLYYTITEDDGETSGISFSAWAIVYVNAMAYVNFAPSDGTCKVDIGSEDISLEYWGYCDESFTVTPVENSAKGYYFAGWYLRVEPTLQNYLNEGYCISTNYSLTITSSLLNPYDGKVGGGDLYALFLKQSWAVFDANGGTVSGGTKDSSDAWLYGWPALYGSTITISNPTKEGFVLSGWQIMCDDSTNCLCSGGGSIVINNDGTSTYTFGDAAGDDNGRYLIRAIWERKQITVTYDFNDGTTDPETKNIKYGEKYGEAPSPTREGYTFAGWYGKNLLNMSELLKENILVKNADGTYTINKIDTKGRFSNYQRISIPANTTITMSYELIDSQVTNTYNTTFNAMLKNVDGGYQYISLRKNSNSMTITTSAEITDMCLYILPDDTIGSYVTFKNLQLEVGSATDYVPYVYGDYPIVSASVVQTPYNHTLFAKWIINDIKVTFDANGGDVTPESKIVHYGSAYGELPTPTRLGYEFNGWMQRTQNLINAEKSTSGYYVNANGIVTAGSSYKCVVTEQIPVKPGTYYTYSGMGNVQGTTVSRTGAQYDANGNLISIIASSSGDNVIFQTADNCAYVILIYHSTAPTPMLEEGSTATSYAPYYSAQKVQDTTVVTKLEDHALVASWSQNIYTLRIIVNNEEFGTVNDGSGAVTAIELLLPYGTLIEVDGNKLNIGELQITATATTITDAYVYSFVRWDGVVISVAGDKTIIAVFEKENRLLNISFESNNTEYGTVSVDFASVFYGGNLIVNGSVLTISNTGNSCYANINNPTSEYEYVFLGWFVGEESANGKVITEHITVTAKFDVIPRLYTVTIEVSDSACGSISDGTNGAKSTMTFDVSYGTAIVVNGNTITVGPHTITATANNLYAFEGWGGIVGAVESDIRIVAGFKIDGATVSVLTSSIGRGD